MTQNDIETILYAAYTGVCRSTHTLMVTIHLDSMTPPGTNSLGLGPDFEAQWPGLGFEGVVLRHVLAAYGY